MKNVPGGNDEYYDILESKTSTTEASTTTTGSSIQIFLYTLNGIKR